MKLTQPGHNSFMLILSIYTRLPANPLCSEVNALTYYFPQAFLFIASCSCYLCLFNVGRKNNQFLENSKGFESAKPVLRYVTFYKNINCS